ncbi:MAG: serine/threonine-protein phosphatase [Microbacterium sp.]|uniref:PP2C family protein-serine/threonine phosphatase n=1 Tax=Microbacterium sp. TaxID=51671 RepID=UPI001AC21F86|nr:protein phosphatase 2C domain-containing protein [Microbacterium sp.]MBN9152506.1 serine/threonine-protein phosphatase [Microbacterium sp.]
MRLICAVVSDVGPHRRINQDAAFVAPWGAAVADGVGGGPAGDLASATIVHRMTAGWHGVDHVDELAVRVRSANWDLRARVDSDPSLAGMATTLTGLVVARGGGMLLVHTGDSRAYRLRDGELTRQTRDDSLVQALIDQGVIGEAEARSHPRRNIVTASLAGADDDRLWVIDADVAQGDRWLLCSDGVSDYLPDSVIDSALASATHPDDAAGALVRLAMDAGSRDNITAVVCDVAPGVPVAEPPRFAGAAAIVFDDALEDTA